MLPLGVCEGNARGWRQPTSHPGRGSGDQVPARFRHHQARIALLRQGFQARHRSSRHRHRRLGRNRACPPPPSAKASWKRRSEPGRRPSPPRLAGCFIGGHGQITGLSSSFNAGEGDNHRFVVTQPSANVHDGLGAGTSNDPKWRRSSRRTTTRGGRIGGGLNELPAPDDAS